jgi:hypothetical protein
VFAALLCRPQPVEFLLASMMAPHKTKWLNRLLRRPPHKRKFVHQPFRLGSVWHWAIKVGRNEIT